MRVHKHDHSGCLNHAMHKAEALCAENGVRLTPIRRRVLELIWQDHKAVKAYDLLQRLGNREGAQAPPTVYRALDFLLEHGLVHKLESLNAYVGCSQPANQHACQFFICRRCHEVSECVDDELDERIRQLSEKRQFTAERHVLEVHGFCKHCRQH